MTRRKVAVVGMPAARQLRLEAAVVLGPESLLPALALLVVTALHSLSPATGAESWRSLFIENCQSLLPIAFGLAAVPLLLRDAEHGTLEQALTLPVPAVAALRLLLVLGGNALLAASWLALLAAAWGPVALGAGLWAALGPTLLLSGLGVLAATAAGRVTVGQLVVIGWVLGDLVLRLLGWGAAFPALQWLDAFAYRWPVTGVAWPAVAGAQAAVGVILLIAVVRRSRALLLRLL